jgi:hypothetical protein
VEFEFEKSKLVNFGSLIRNLENGEGILDSTGLSTRVRAAVPGCLGSLLDLAGGSMGFWLVGRRAAFLPFSSPAAAVTSSGKYSLDCARLALG